MLNRKRQARLRRLGGVALSLMVAIPAALIFWSGSPVYSNYLGGVVFAPLALVAGIGLLVITLFWPRILESSKKLRGKAARRAEQAEHSKSAVEEFDRPWTGGR